MEKEGNYSATGNNIFPGLDYSLSRETSADTNSNQMVDYMLSNSSHQQQQSLSPNFCGSTSFDKLSFADVMQFADFGPKLALNQGKTPEEESGIDPVYFLKFPVLNEKAQNDEQQQKPELGQEENLHEGKANEGKDGENEAGKSSVALRFNGENVEKSGAMEGNKSKRKRARTVKTSEEVESQRMTHIAVERNRRKQMNEHLRVLRSLMPGSYVQRGDQASIIGGAIEFVRELEQLLQCLESQKRRRLYGDSSQRPIPDSSITPQNTSTNTQPPPQLVFPPMPLPTDDQDQMKLMEYETAGFQEETAESKSCLADVEVKLLGFDALIKILSRRRPGQLIKTIAALEDLQLNILHTNITTIEQTVLYSFNVKVSNETRFTAEDIANSVQQIFSFIHANTSI